MKTILPLLISSLFLQYVCGQTTYLIIDDNKSQTFPEALLEKFSGIIRNRKT